MTTSPVCEAGPHLESSYGGDDLGTLGLAGSTLVTCAVIKYAATPRPPPPPWWDTGGGQAFTPQAPVALHCWSRTHRALTFPVIHSLWSTMAPECCAASHTSLQRNYSWNETQAHFSLIRYNPHLKTPESFFVDSLNNCADIAHEY